MQQLGVSIRIGAALAGGYRATIGAAMQGIGEIDQGMGGLQRRVLDLGQAWAGLAGLKSLVGGASDLEQDLTAAGITADLTNDQVASLRRQLRELAVPERTNQSVQNLLRGYTALVSAGMSDSNARGMIEALGRSATASQADIEDLSQTAFVLNNALGIAPENMGAAIDKLTFAGKQGAFELKDMARHLPALGAAAQAVGMKGEGAVSSLAAALQMAKEGAADPSTAANNMANFLAKMTAGETVRNFAKAGVNLKKVLADAMAKGQNPMEAVIEKTMALTKGDPFKLSALFSDQQVQAYLKPVMSGYDRYKAMRDDIATGSAGTADQDFARMMGTFNMQAQGAANAVGMLADSIGRSLLPPLGGVISVATPVITWLADVADRSPGVTMAVTGLGAALLILPPALRLVAFGIRAIGVAARVSPIGLLVSGLVIGAGLVYDNWETVRGLFIGIWEPVKAKWTEFSDFVGGVWAKISGPVDKAMAFMGFGNTVNANSGVAAPPAAGDSIPAPSPAGAGQALASAVAASAPASSPASAGQALASAAGGKGQVDVNVNLAGLPRGSEVSTQSQGPGVGDVDTYLGAQMVGP